MTKMIDEKLKSVLDYVDNFIFENSYPPSVREICAALGIKSTASAYSYLDKLEKQGLITKSPTKNRAIATKRNNDTKTNVFFSPLIGTITAGKPIFAHENFEEMCPLPNDFAGADDTFLLRVKGDSMKDAGIFDGDKIIVQKSNTADNGDIVVALFEEVSTVKRFFIKNNKYILHPENEIYSDIELDSVEILGKVIGLYRKIV